jgi:hypothetical protein
MPTVFLANLRDAPAVALQPDVVPRAWQLAEDEDRSRYLLCLMPTGSTTRVPDEHLPPRPSHRLGYVPYLNTRDIAINVVFFQVFEHGPDKLLSRAWLIDPGETQANVASTTTTKGDKEPWNGEFYVSFGDAASRSWEDARRFGYISGGGGSWYSQTLKLLSPGDRVWVKIPKKGYVGVGTVLESVQPVKDFKVQTDSGEQPALVALKHAEKYQLTADDPERAEYFVRVKWLDTVPENKAVNEVGLFGNQNTVCQPTTPKWRHTVERLKMAFPNWGQ